MKLLKPPDKVIGPEANPYMLRWFVFKGRDKWPRVYIHKFMRSDDDRALHDHPWWFVSIVLRGGYYEITESGRKWRGAGSIAFRRATATHRVQLCGCGYCKHPVTLFIAGPVKRMWGFWCPVREWSGRIIAKIFVPWEDFDGCPGDG